LLAEGAVSAALVRGDTTPGLARAARAAAEVLIDASVKASEDICDRRSTSRRRGTKPIMPAAKPIKPAAKSKQEA
jgi:hypothetical protein